jgi:hypothetical protein
VYGRLDEVPQAHLKVILLLAPMGIISAYMQEVITRPIQNLVTIVISGLNLKAKIMRKMQPVAVLVII